MDNIAIDILADGLTSVFVILNKSIMMKSGLSYTYGKPASTPEKLYRPHGYSSKNSVICLATSSSCFNSHSQIIKDRQPISERSCWFRKSLSLLPSSFGSQKSSFDLG